MRPAAGPSLGRDRCRAADVFVEVGKIADGRRVQFAAGLVGVGRRVCVDTAGFFSGGVSVRCNGPPVETAAACGERLHWCTNAAAEFKRRSGYRRGGGRSSCPAAQGNHVRGVIMAINASNSVNLDYDYGSCRDSILFRVGVRYRLLPKAELREHRT